MKINSINNSKNQNISHKAGQIRVFSDFDRTFLPSSHADFQENNNPMYIQGIKDYFKKFKNYKERRKDSLNFTITTGRTFDEFKKMAEISRERNFGMPLPDSLIVKNGSDEHLRIGSDLDFYENGKFPFSYNHTNKEKDARLLELTGWDGAKFKEKIIEIFRKHDLRIVEAGSEHSAKNYGKDSFFADGNIPIESQKVFNETEKADWVVGLRKDGNSKIYITYPYDMNSNKERLAKKIDILNDIGAAIENIGINDCYTELHQYPNECGGRPWQIFEPILDYHLGAKIEGQNGLTKLFDTKEALRKAKLNNDLVIAAGDSTNDLVMLNPILYFEEQIERYNRSHPEKPFLANDYSNPKKFIELLDSNDVLAKEFMDLPFMGIVVTDNDKTSNKQLNELIEYFAKGKYKKIITTKSGNLDEGIDNAIKLYAEKNKEFKSKLKTELLIDLFGLEDDLSKIDPAPLKTKDSRFKSLYYVLGAITIAMGFLGYKIINKIKGENKK